jgi:hypothetical protein
MKTIPIESIVLLVAIAEQVLDKVSTKERRDVRKAIKDAKVLISVFK